MIKKSSCNLVFYSGKDHPHSKYGRIETCLKLMAKSGRETFTARDVEKSTDLWHMTITHILSFTEGVANMGRPKKRPMERIWYFTGEPINVFVFGEKK